MTEAKYCDGCKNIFPSDEITSISIEGVFNETCHRDYCEKCFDKFRDYIDK